MPFLIPFGIPFGNAFISHYWALQFWLNGAHAIGNWVAFLGPESGEAPKTGAGGEKIRPVSGVRGRYAHPAALFLHACGPLAGLHLVQHR